MKPHEAHPHSSSAAELQKHADSSQPMAIMRNSEGQFKQAATLRKKTKQPNRKTGRLDRCAA